VTIHDQNRNYYNRVFIENPPIVEQTIPPGETINDIIVFEQPLKLFGYLDLDLPSHAYVPYVFRIPSSLVEQRAEAPKPAPPPAPKVQQPPPPVEPPYDPEKDLQLRAKVLADYRSGTAAIERKAKGMGFDRGRKYKLTAYENLIEEIASNYNLTADQVRRMIRR
jgi:hypothetical protein